MNFNLEFASPKYVKSISEARGEPSWLAKDRLQALQTFQNMPVEPSPIFIRHTDMRGVDVAGVAPLDDIHMSLPDVEYDGMDLSALVEVEQGRIARIALSKDLKEHGIELIEAADLIEKRPEFAKTLLMRPDSLPKNDKFGKMSRALFTNALVLSLPPSFDVHRPFLFHWKFSGERTAHFTRTIIHLARESSASIIEEFSSPHEGTSQSLFGNSAEILLEEGAHLRYAAIGRAAKNIISFTTRQAVLEKDASVQYALGSFGGFYNKTRNDTLLAGRGSSIRQIEVVYGIGQERFDSSNFVRHNAPDTVSDVLCKAVMHQKSRSALKGVMTIEEQAANAESFLGQYAMLLSKQAKSTAIPSLEIKTNNVQKAKHSASVAQVDEEQVFYLQTRGIPKSEARKMLVQAFLAPLVEQVEFSQAKERLYELIEAKWQGGDIYDG